MFVQNIPAGLLWGSWRTVQRNRSWWEPAFWKGWVAEKLWWTELRCFVSSHVHFCLCICIDWLFTAVDEHKRSAVRSAFVWMRSASSRTTTNWPNEIRKRPGTFLNELAISRMQYTWWQLPAQRRGSTSQKLYSLEKEEKKIVHNIV